MKRNGQVRDDNELIEINKKIVSIGDKIGRKTVATCDVHFLDPKDEMYRRVLMGAQGFEDADNQAPAVLENHRRNDGRVQLSWRQGRRDSNRQYC